jgi:hypothetical protein
MFSWLLVLLALLSDFFLIITIRLRSLLNRSKQVSNTNSLVVLEWFCGWKEFVSEILWSILMRIRRYLPLVATYFDLLLQHARVVLEMEASECKDWSYITFLFSFIYTSVH